MNRTGPGLKVRVSNEVAYVSATDIRTQFTTIYSEVLPKYGTVVIERNRTPVAVLKLPEDVELDIEFEEY